MAAHSLFADPTSLRELAVRTLAEDVGRGDITTSLVVPADATGSAGVVAREPLVVAGLEAARLVFEVVGGAAIEWAEVSGDGATAAAGDEIARLRGPLGQILTAERTALNLLARGCAVATHAARLASLIEGTPAKIVDTRKTTPGLRVLEKYAVRVGGCHNHRFGLDDGILIKDNHVKAAGGIDAAVRRAVAGAPHGLKVEVEIDDLEQLEPAIAAGADAVLLDNMTPELVREAVAQAGGRVILEASGGISEANLREFAITGVDLVSMGALTHSAPHVDLALEVH